MPKISWALAASALALGGCAAKSVMMTVDPPSPHTGGFASGTDFVLDRDYVYSIGASGRSITVPAGFVTDYASIPIPARFFFERQGRHSRAAIVHDYLYWTQKCSRAQSDNLFWIAMKESGVRSRDRRGIYTGVDVGGGAGWRTNQRERDAGLPRVVPPAEVDASLMLTWPEARELLRKKGVKDPVFEIDPAVCALGNKRQVP